MNEWQPIETAPKDRWILGMYGIIPMVVEWNEEGWSPWGTSAFFPITHWMPLPEPPK